MSVDVTLLVNKDFSELNNFILFPNLMQSTRQGLANNFSITYDLKQVFYELEDLVYTKDYTPLKFSLTTKPAEIRSSKKSIVIQ